MSAIDELKKSMEESGFPLNVKISPYQLRPSDVLNAILELAERVEALEVNSVNAVKVGFPEEYNKAKMHTWVGEWADEEKT